MQEEQKIGIYRTPVVKGEQSEFLALTKQEKVYLFEVFIGNDYYPPDSSHIQIRPPPYAEYIDYMDKLHQITKVQLGKLEFAPNKKVAPKTYDRIINKLSDKYPDLFSK